MKRILLALSLVFVANLLVSQIEHIPSIAITFDYPDAEHTYITGIGKGQVITGYYKEANGNYKGFIFDRHNLI